MYTLALLAIAVFAQDPQKSPTKEPYDLSGQKALAAKFAPVDIQADLSALPPSERAALAKIVQAARLMDGLFLRQVWAGNDSLLFELAGDSSPLGKERLANFLIQKGPWSRTDHNAPFIPGQGDKPGGANFYPADVGKAELETWMNALPPGAKAQAKSFYTVIRKNTQGKLVIVPYATEYYNELAQASLLLREAAALTAQPTLKRFLETRAAAFLSNDYYESDLAWMELDASLEPTIGPYEVYEDDWFNLKAAFEAFIAVRDDKETDKLQKFSSELQELENRLPIEPSLRNPKIGTLAPIRVVNVVFTSGDANHGVQTAAYNLPNDERVIKEKGSKRVMIKNVQEAKFKSVLLPIAKLALSSADRKNVAFDAFFTHILMHELMHGLGPHQAASGQTVRDQLKDAYSTIEEAKADISGLWALQQLVDKGVLDKTLERTMYTTFLASSFRTLRFGITEAHGRGMAVQLNYLLDAGAFTLAKDGTFAVDAAKMKTAAEALTRELMTLQSEGNYDKAKAMFDKLAVVRPEVQKMLDKLKNVPTDIRPKFAPVSVLAPAPTASAR